MSAPPPTIALLTDFGLQDHYVGVMKGVILSVNANARIIDISHSADPQDLLGAYLLLQNSYKYFPRGTIFVAVVDPEVGTERAVLCVQTQDHFFLAPDNGLISFLDRTKDRKRIYSVENERLFLQPVSNTFHGRDIFAPVAAHLSLGLDPANLGKVCSRMRRLSTPEAKVSKKGEIRGEVVSIDIFGNLISNIPAGRLVVAKKIEIRVGRNRIKCLTQTYARAKKGALIAVPGSRGMLEISVTNGSAAKKTRARIGTQIVARHS